MKEVSRKLAAELATETQRLLDLYDTVPTTNEIIPGSESTSILSYKTETDTKREGFCIPPSLVPTDEETPEQLPVDQLLRLKLKPADDVKGWYTYHPPLSHSYCLPWTR